MLMTEFSDVDSDRAKETPEAEVPANGASSHGISSTDDSQQENLENPKSGSHSAEKKNRKESGGFWRKLLQLDDSPESIALGAAVGMFIAWTPTVGIQMIMVLIMAAVIPMNRIAAFIMIYISNPVTMVPMYYINYVLGLTLLAREGMTYDAFLQLWNTTLELAEKETFWLATKTFMEQLGLPMLTALFVGGGVIGLLTSIPTYPLTLRWVRRYRELRSDSKGTVSVVNDGREA